MPENIISKVIGHYDGDGYFYCEKHGKSGMKSLTIDDIDYEQCCICGKIFDTSVID